jgi:hypothetical protein
MLGRLGFAALALAAATSDTMSAEATIGDVSINLPTPVGFCELIDREPSDKRLIEYAADRVAKRGPQGPRHFRRLPATRRLARGQTKDAR